MTHTASLSWFARHELYLAWRDWVALMSGGRRLKDLSVVFGMAIFAAGLHWIAYAVLSPAFNNATTLELATLINLTACLLLSFTMMLSQAMESVTRAFYSRDDLDLILSSPAPASHLFAVRIAMMVLTTAMMSGIMLAPFINMAAILGGAHWLTAYAVVLAVAAIAVGVAVLLTLTLFKTCGPKRTRLISQIAAAVVGASFLIGIQVVAVFYFGSMSRFSLLNSDSLASWAANLGDWVWIPARAIAGDTTALGILVFTASVIFAYATMVGARQFRSIIVEALGMADDRISQSVANPNTFRQLSSQGTLIRKEWMLMARDPWLMSQSLMQILYLIPPGLMLWINYGAKTELSAILAPVIVMALGQLAGGLAWLTISGEDAPDLVATAPVSRGSLLSAKIQAVLLIVLAIAAPIALAVALMSPWGGMVTLTGALVAATCAIIIQLLFRAQAKRTNFRRRHVASRVSTFCEAFASILCAGTAALVAAGSWIAVIPAVLLVVVMATAWAMSPKQA